MEFRSERGHTLILLLLFVVAGYFLMQRAWVFGAAFFETRYRAHLALSAARVGDAARYSNQG